MLMEIHLIEEMIRIGHMAIMASASVHIPCIINSVLLINILGVHFDFSVENLRTLEFEKIAHVSPYLHVPNCEKHRPSFVWVAN